MKLKLFPKIALILIALATIPVLVVGWKTYSLNKEHLETNILELHTNLANALSLRIDRDLDGLVREVRSFIEALRIQGTISAAPFQAFLASNDQFISIAFVSPSGKELLKASSLSFPEEKPLKDRSRGSAFAAYQSQKLGPEDLIEPKYQFYFEEGDPRLAIVLPNHPQNFSQGAFYILVSLSDLWEQISAEAAGVGGGGGREAFVVDEEGVVIAHSKNPKLALDKTSFKNHPIVAEALQERSIGSKEFTDQNGKQIVGAYARVHSTGWVSVIQQPKETAFYAIDETRRSAMKVVLISIVAASIIAFLFAKQLSKPIFALIEGARKIARGEFDHYVSVKTGDEMSDLANTFNEMVKELNRYNALQVDRIIEEKTRTESVIFSIADGIILTDHDGNIQLLNDRAVKVFGLEKSTGDPENAIPGLGGLIGKNLMELLSDAKTKETLKELIARPEKSAAKEIAIQSDSYEQHYQLSAGLVHVTGTDKKLGVVTVVHDVTLERQMDQMKENFLHSITHDLRNPMTSIMGFLKFLIDGTAGPVSDQQKQMLMTMERASVRLLGMINDILDIAKVEAGKLEIELAPIQMSDLIEDIYKLYEPAAQKKSVRLNLILPENKDAMSIQGDINQLERVIGNLVVNALKFSSTDGKITIALEDMQDKVQVSVTDDGPGIPDEYREKVFDKFQQVTGQRKGGTGLGLTICRYFVELHRGKIWVEANAPKGSRFIFRLPKRLARSESGEIVCGEAAV